MRPRHASILSAASGRWGGACPSRPAGPDRRRNSAAWSRRSFAALARSLRMTKGGWRLPLSDLAEGVDDLEAGGAGGGEEAAEEAHGQGEDEASDDQGRRHPEVAQYLREGAEVHRSRRLGQERREDELSEDDPEESPGQAKHQRLQDEGQEDRAPREPDRAQCPDLAGARRDLRVHRVHRPEGRPDGREEAHDERQRLDRVARDHLLVVVLPLRLALELQPLVPLDRLDVPVRRGSVGRADEDGGEDLPLELLLQVLRIRPDLGLVRASRGVEEADDDPPEAPGLERLAELHVRVALGKVARHDRLVAAGLEHPAVHDLHRGPHLDADRVHPADLHVAARLAVLAGQADQRDDLRRDVGPPVRTPLDAGQGLDLVRLVPRDHALHLRLGAHPQRQDVSRRGGDRQGPRDSLHQRQHTQEDRHHESDDEDGHPRGDPSHEQVAEVVFQRDGHQTTCLSPSTILIRDELIAGTKPAKTPTPTDTVKAMTRVGTVTRKLISQAEIDVFSPTARSIGIRTNFAINTPRMPPRRDMRTDSERMKERMWLRRNPSVRITAISVTRSRADMATVLATISVTAKRMMREIPLISSLTLPIISMNWSWNCFSVSVLVGASLFSNIRSMAAATLGTSSPFATFR